MSTDSTGPTEPNRAGPAEPIVPAPTPGAAAPGSPAGASAGASAAAPTAASTAAPTAGHPASVGAAEELTDGSAPEEPREPGWITRNTTLLITLMLAVIVAGGAIIGVGLYRHSVNQHNADTAAAFRATVAAQGARVETVECDGDTCAAVIGGQAYTVLVQKDANGKQHFGVSNYVGH